MHDSRHETQINGKRTRTTYRNFSSQLLENWLKENS
jgi:hypothetical protein